MSICHFLSVFRLFFPFLHCHSSLTLLFFSVILSLGKSGFSVEPEEVVHGALIFCQLFSIIKSELEM